MSGAVFRLAPSRAAPSLRALFSSTSMPKKAAPKKPAAKKPAAAKKADGPNNFPKLHNAMWPGLVGKGSPGGEPFIDLDTMLDLTAKAEVNGVKFDGVDLFLFEPHVSIDASDDDLKKLAEKVRSRNLVIGSVVAPVWPPTGGGSAMGTEAERKQFVEQVKKGCRI